MHSLPLYHRLEGRTVLLLGTGVAADAKRRLIERAGATVTDDPSAPVALAFVVLSDDVTVATVDALKARGVLVNVVDHPELCDFTTPAIIDRDPVTIAIGTGGASAGLAKALRQRLEALLPTGLGGLASALSGARDAMRQRWPDTDARRRAIDAALDPGGPLDPMQAMPDDAVANWLAGKATATAGRVEILHLTSGDPDDLTLRAARLLGQADAVWHDGSVPNSILDRARADAARSVSSNPPDAPAHGLILWVEICR